MKLWVNLRISKNLSGQFIILKKFEGYILKFQKWGVNFRFLNLLGQFENFGKFKDHNAKFEKL